MMRHTMVEAWLLFRARLIVSGVLALALAVPLCLAGVTLATGKWLRPLTSLSDEKTVVAVLLHPRLDEPARRTWMASKEADQPEWRLELVPPEHLAQRLSSWFPYMADLFEGRDAEGFLPSLVEISTADVSSVEGLADEPEVLALGPRSSVHRLIGNVAAGLAYILGVLTIILLVAAAALASIWVHLEIYRHADELTIMRLIGATEWSIRGPFLVAVVIPGIVAAVVSAIGTRSVTSALSSLAMSVGLPEIGLPAWILGMQIGAGVLLPLLAGIFTLSRHARLEVEA